MTYRGKKLSPYEYGHILDNTYMILLPFMMYEYYLWFHKCSYG